MSPLRIVVVGAGIAGLSVGVALSRIGAHVEIYEQAPKLLPGGGGMLLTPSGVRCLARFGLARDIAELGGRLETMAYFGGRSGAPWARFALQPLIDAVGERLYPVARADLQAMLLAQYGRECLHLGAKLLGIEDDGREVVARFEDGRVARADVLVGADGISSAVCRHLLDRPAARRPTGYSHWTGLVPMDNGLGIATESATWLADGNCVAWMPVSSRRACFFITVPTAPGRASDRAAWRDQLRHQLAGWAPPVQELVDRLDPATTARSDVVDIDPLPACVQGRVVLVGDAAHASLPDVGQGASHAMEDAIVLASTLQTHTLGIDDALHRYQQRRKDRAAAFVQAARERFDLEHARDAGATQRWLAFLRAGNGRAILDATIADTSASPLA